MAKRRRLSALGIGEDITPVAKPAPQRIPPVARIAADAATQSALEGLAQELCSAREDGRMIVELPFDSIDAQHLTRDRLAFDAEDMSALIASIRDRGQQTPIEVVALANGQYGLISGARRLAAIKQLSKETSHPRFGNIKALLRPAANAPDAYLAMVEENEIRSDLSFYERARLAHEAARLGVFDSPALAVKALFIHVSPSKRSKILNFVALHEAVGSALRFPEAIPEKLGLPLVKAIERDPPLAKRITEQLIAAAPESSAEERALLNRALSNLQPTAVDKERTVRKSVLGIRITGRSGQINLSGKGVTEPLISDLIAWLESRN